MIILLFILASICATAQISTPTQYRKQSFDVQHYDAAITFPDPSSKTIVADVSITVLWTDSVKAPSFPFHLRGLTIDSVFVNGAVSTFATLGLPASDTMHHRVSIPHDVSENRTDTVRVFYHGTMTSEVGSQPWGGVHYEDSVLYVLGVGFSNPSVGATQHWLACYDHPSDKATFHATFTVPVTPWKVASVGTEVFSRRPWPPGQAIYEWEEEHPTATYLLTFAIAPYHKIELPASVPHVFYSLARDTAKSRVSFSRVPSMTSVFEQAYGAYPFSKVGYCNTLRGAMEHQTMISFPVSLAQRADTVNSTAAHELAHQWFGDCVSPLDFRYAWLTESFATYSEALWHEALLGKRIYLQTQQSKARAYITRIAGTEGTFALEDFPRSSPSSNYPETIYQKGSVVVGMARAIAGDSAFYSSLKQYINSYRYGVATTDSMREALRPALGSLTDDFFAEWVTGIGWAQIHVDVNTAKSSDQIVTIKQEQQKLHPTWPIFSSLPLNVVYTRNGFAGIDTLDVLMYFDSTGTLEFTCTQLLGINNGTICRSLVEILRTTANRDYLHEDKQSLYTIRPNPASDHIILTRRQSETACTIRIIDMRGATVHSQLCSVGEEHTSIPVQELAGGSYSIIIEDGSERIRLPLSVIRE